MLSNISDLKEQLENIQLKNESLTRDKMKLQNEKSAMGRGKGITGSSRIGTGMGSTIGGSRGLSNPYGNFTSGIGKSNLMEKGLDKILDADVSGIGLTNSSYISTSNKGENNFTSNTKYKSQYNKNNNNDLDDIDFNDK